jgi:hypothetical protein
VFLKIFFSSARSMEKNKFAITGNVELYELPKNFTYSDYIALKKHGEHLKYLKDKGSNLVVDAGLQQIIDLMLDVSDVGFAYCRVGSGTNTPAAGDTDMQTIIGSGLAVTNRYRSSLSANFDTFFSTADNNGSWNETGIATTSTGGILLCRRKFSSTFVKASTNTAVITWVITLAAVAD